LRGGTVTAEPRWLGERPLSGRLAQEQGPPATVMAALQLI
jgi:hypothetical protein